MRGMKVTCVLAAVVVGLGLGASAAGADGIPLADAEGFVFAFDSNINNGSFGFDGFGSGSLDFESEDSNGYTHRALATALVSGGQTPSVDVQGHAMYGSSQASASVNYAFRVGTKPGGVGGALVDVSFSANGQATVTGGSPGNGSAYASVSIGRPFNVIDTAVVSGAGSEVISLSGSGLVGAGSLVRVSKSVRGGAAGGIDSAWEYQAVADPHFWITDGQLLPDVNGVLRPAHELYFLEFSPNLFEGPEVPEPSTLALVALTLGAVLFRRGRAAG